MAKTLKHLSDFGFIAAVNLKLARRDSYLAHVRSSLKPDTLAALRNVPLNMVMLFPDTILKKADEGIASFEKKGHSGSSPHKKIIITLMRNTRNNKTAVNLTSQLGRILVYYGQG